MSESSTPTDRTAGGEPTLELPFSNAGEDFSLSRISHVRNQTSRASGLPRLARILVVDDDLDMVTTLTALLRSDAFEVHGAYNGREALRVMEDFDPDALIVDLIMPGMTGWELAQNVRQGAARRRVILIALSGNYDEPANKLVLDKGGFDYFLSKPCDPSIVLNLLRPLKVMATGTSKWRRSDK